MMAAEKKSSTPNRPFLRRIVVTLGPLEEWRDWVSDQFGKYG